MCRANALPIDRIVWGGVILVWGCVILVWGCARASGSGPNFITLCFLAVKQFPNTKKPHAWSPAKIIHQQRSQETVSGAQSCGGNRNLATALRLTARAAPPNLLAEPSRIAPGGVCDGNGASRNDEPQGCARYPPLPRIAP